ncbi:MAG: ABC transporter permease, partial [Actinomycetota bacterium]|nr:ABC transporter permease [Actinomycetota bacterium]
MVPAEQEQDADGGRWRDALRELTSGGAAISVLAVLLALVAGAILIVFTNKDVQAASGYFFGRPLDTLRAMWDAVAGAYTALFQGAVYNFRRPGFLDGIKPLTETLAFSTPLIAAGLGVALSFRVGLFNIGGRGQMLMAAAAAAYVGFAPPFTSIPGVLHLIVAVIAGLAAG